MKIFKLSQDFLFSDEEMKETEGGKWSDDILDHLEFATSWTEIKNILNQYNENWEEINFTSEFGTEKIIAVYRKNKWNQNDCFVIDSDSYPSLIEASEWINGINEWDLVKYIDVSEDDFWENLPSCHVYHGTYDKYVEDIMRNGLLVKNLSRGISNRSTGSSIFASIERDVAESGGYDKIIDIDVCAMKEDGYMPRVSMEEPLIESEMRASLANKIGYDNYVSDEFTSDGLREDTIIFFDNIPAKYLSLISD